MIDIEKTQGKCPEYERIDNVYKLKQWHNNILNKKCIGYMKKL